MNKKHHKICIANKKIAIIFISIFPYSVTKNFEEYSCFPSCMCSKYVPFVSLTGIVNSVRRAAAIEMVQEAEKTFYSVRRQNRAIFAARIEMALGLPCFFVMRSTKLLASADSRISSTAASPKAQRRCALPIFAPPVP